MVTKKTNEGNVRAFSHQASKGEANTSNIVKHPAIMEVSAHDAQEYIESMLSELCDFAKLAGRKDILAFLEITNRAIKDNAQV